MIYVTANITIKADTDAEMQAALARATDMGLKDTPVVNATLRTITFVVTQTVENL